MKYLSINYLDVKLIFRNSWTQKEGALKLLDQSVVTIRNFRFQYVASVLHSDVELDKDTVESGVVNEMRKTFQWNGTFFSLNFFCLYESNYLFYFTWIFIHRGQKLLYNVYIRSNKLKIVVIVIYLVKDTSKKESFTYFLTKSLILLHFP